MTRVPVFLQSEVADCGLVCLAMVRSALGCWTEPAQVRAEHGGSLRGSGLKDIYVIAESLGMLPRALKCDLVHLSLLALPCVLHWDFNHFVVLEKAGKRALHIVDPALGRRRIPLADASAHFTGVALELRRGPDFRDEARPASRGWAVLAITSGWRMAAWHVLALSMALEFFALAVPLFTQLALDNIVTSSDWDLLVLMVIGFALVLLAQEAIGTARGMMIGRVGHELKLHWATYLFQHVVRLPLATLESRTLGDLMSRFRSIEQLQRLVATSAVEAVVDGITSLLLFALMWMYSPMLSAIAAAACITYIAIRWAASHWFRENGAQRLVLMAREQGFFVETFRAMVPIKMFRGESGRLQRWQEIFGHLLGLETRAHRGQVFMRHSARLLAGAENLAVLGCGVGLVLKSSAAAPFTVGMLMAFIAYRTQFSGRVTALADFIAEAHLLKLHDGRIAELLALHREPVAVERGEARLLEPTIELRNVGFRYGASGPWVVRHCSLRIEPGEHVVLVGASGGGKTTLLKIMLGLLEPTEGEVLFGGRPIAQLGPGSLRSVVGAVMQDDVLIAGSIIDNVAFAAAQPDPQRVEECCKLAQVHADIAQLPMGYRSLAGELGAGFSGGQRQRIMIARALYKQPQILAFDEATSHLDATAEIMLGHALERLGLTVISIAHRHETIRHADRAFEVSCAACTEVDVPQLRRAAV